MINFKANPPVMIQVTKNFLHEKKRKATQYNKLQLLQISLVKSGLINTMKEGDKKELL